jgi:hypothetical protein
LSQIIPNYFLYFFISLLNGQKYTTTIQNAVNVNSLK